ncbi:hypothetical protein B5F11_17710 [Anaerotruncus colihominis]|uniref:Uncharacterized protein n=1 Tax=Anaerotruncus colihominis TaxID=169435 RepID=A0A1Y4MFJ9_9FIRM|nr:hypothetical protein B5F11_17710 [Anaerotruncus colihominis]
MFISSIYSPIQSSSFYLKITRQAAARRKTGRPKTGGKKAAETAESACCSAFPAAFLFTLQKILLT